MLSTLFTNLREHTIESKGVDFTEDLVPFESIQDLRNSESQLFFSSFQELLNFNDSADFAKKEGKAKSCKKGYPCGGSCIKAGYNCKKAVTGQARTYAEFLAQQNRQSKKSVQKPLNKSDKTQDTGNSKGTKKKQGETEMVKLNMEQNFKDNTSLLPVEFAPLSQVKDPGTRGNYTENQIQELAKAILSANGTINPVRIRETGPESYELLDGDLQYYALQEVYKQNKRRGNVVAIITETNKNKDALALQNNILKRNEGKVTRELEDSPLKENFTKNDLLISQSFVPVKQVKDPGTRDKFSDDDIEQMADAMLAAYGTVKPAILKETAIEEYEVVDGDLQYYAQKRAKEKNPRRGEFLPTILMTDDNKGAVTQQIKLSRTRK